MGVSYKRGTPVKWTPDAEMGRARHVGPLFPSIPTKVIDLLVARHNLLNNGLLSLIQILLLLAWKLSLPKSKFRGDDT